MRLAEALPVERPERARLRAAHRGRTRLGVHERELAKAGLAVEALLHRVRVHELARFVHGVHARLDDVEEVALVALAAHDAPRYATHLAHALDQLAEHLVIEVAEEEVVQHGGLDHLEVSPMGAAALAACTGSEPLHAARLRCYGRELRARLTGAARRGRWRGKERAHCLERGRAGSGLVQDLLLALLETHAERVNEARRLEQREQRVSLGDVHEGGHAQDVALLAHQLFSLPQRVIEHVHEQLEVFLIRVEAAAPPHLLDELLELVVPDEGAHLVLSLGGAYHLAHERLELGDAPPLDGAFMHIPRRHERREEAVEVERKPIRRASPPGVVIRYLLRALEQRAAHARVRHAARQSSGYAREAYRRTPLGESLLDRI